MSTEGNKHLVYLIFKYFVRNRRRTYRAILILGIGISMVLSTHMLMSGFIIQIEEFASLIDSSNQVVYLTGENLNENTLLQLKEDLESQSLTDYSEFRYYITQITYNGVDQNIEFLKADLLRLDEWGWISLSADNVQNSLFVSDKTGFSNVSNVFTGLPGSPEHLYTYKILSDISADIIADTDYTTELDSALIRVAVRLNTVEQLNTVNAIAEEYNFEIIDKEPSNRFLEITADQITVILILLQIVLSFLLILSIFYVMITLVTESAPDLRVLHMIGYGKKKIFLLFLGQSILASLLAVIFAFLFSLLLLQTLLPFLTLTDLPYTLIFIDYRFLGITTVQSVVVGVLAGIYPAKVGAEFYG